MNKRDELAENHCQGADHKHCNLDFKAGWDACEKENTSELRLLKELLRIYLDEPSFEILRELEKALGPRHE